MKLGGKQFEFSWEENHALWYIGNVMSDPGVKIEKEGEEIAHEKAEIIL